MEKMNHWHMVPGKKRALKNARQEGTSSFKI